MSLAKKAQYVDVNDLWAEEPEIRDASDEYTDASIADFILGDSVGDADDVVVEAEDDPEDGSIVVQVEPKAFDFTNFSLPRFPGADTDEDETEVAVEEEEPVKVEERDIWDWESGGISNYLQWLYGMLQRIPKYHSGETAGIERVISFLTRLDQSISKAVRSDLKDELNISVIENIRKELRSGIRRSEEQLDRITAGQKRKKAKSDVEYQGMLVKEAQKISGVNKTTITVDILLARVAKVCINGMVSGGHDIEDLFDRQIKKYNLNVREQASVMQLLEDFGYPLRRDRGFLRDEEIDRTRSDNFDWNGNYPA